MKLLHKFFLAFFISNLVIVGILLVITGINLNLGFNAFVQSVEQKHFLETKNRLTEFYRQHNSWDIFIADEKRWKDLVSPQQTRNPPPKQRKEGRPRKPPPRDQSTDFLKTTRRISLYDASKNVVIGRPFLTDNPKFEPITLNDETIGWLGLVPSKLAENSPANEFLTEQYQTYYWVAGIVTFCSLIMAAILAKLLTSPIKIIINSTENLIGGNYKTRIEKTSQDELGSLSNQINDLAHTLERNQSNRFQWMSDTSHELRTPLTVIKSQLEAIRDGIFQADEKRISLFISEIDNLSRIVDDLYQLSSSDAGALTYKKQQLNPIKLLLDVTEGFDQRFKKHGLTISVDALDSMLLMRPTNMLGDKKRLQQLFSNLLENACRYTDRNGTIQILANVTNKTLTLKIQDSAPGVSKRDQDRLFDRFYRVDQSRNRHNGGSGLGLSICKQIVNAHQGEITASYSPLGGLCIKITFKLQH